MSESFPIEVCGIITIDERGSVRKFDRAAEQLFGYAADEVLGQNVSMLMPSPYREEHDAYVARYLAGGQARRQGICRQVTGLRRDGTRFPLELVLTEEAAGAQRLFTGFVRDIGARLRNEESHRRLAALVESSSDAILSKSLDGTILSWNRGAERIYGYTAAEAVGRNISILVPPERVEELSSLLERLQRGEPVDHLETVRRHRDGRRVVVSLSLSPILESSGAPIGISAIARDITQRKHAERRLAAQHTVTRILAESATFAEATPRLLQAVCEALDWELGVVWHADPKAGVLRFMRSWAEPGAAVAEFDSHSRELDFIPGEGCLGRVWAEGQAEWLPNVTAEPDFRRSELAMRFGLHSWIGFPILLRGEVFGVIEAFSRQIEEPDEELLQMIRSVGSQVGQFIERRRMQNELARERDFISAVLDTAGALVVVLDRAGRIVRFNRACERLTGYSASEVRGRVFWEFLLIPEEVESVQGVFERLVAADLPITHENFWVARDGTRRLVAWANTGLLDEKGSVEYVIATGLDITEKEKLEEHLLRAERLESIGLLAGGIAHDFNNLLGEILCNVSLARSSLGTPAEADAILAEAEKATARATGLTKQLLTFARGGAPIKALVALPGLVRDTVRFALSGSSLRCECSLPEDLWSVEVDAGQIQQAIQNLVVNAVQAMPGGGCLAVRARNVTAGAGAESLPLPAEGRFVELAIEDRGTGIPPEDLPRIFDPYFTTKPGGTGLGLATTHSIVTRHGGFVHVESTLGSGTTMLLYLPASDRAPAAARSNGGAVTAGGSARILLMEDHEGLRRATAKMLRRMGYEVEGAADGTEALALYRSALESGHRFDAVIMDLTIPGGMGGKETIQHLLRLDPHVRAIAASGYSTDPILANFREYGFQGSVSKPFGRKELGEILQGVLAASR